MSKQSGTTGRSPARRYPVVTVATMGAAFLFILVLFFGDLPSPYLFRSYLRLGAIYLFVPSVLFLIGAISAPFHNSVGSGAQAGWGIAAGLCALFAVPAIWIVAVLLFGP